MCTTSCRLFIVQVNTGTATLEGVAVASLTQAQLTKTLLCGANSTNATVLSIAANKSVACTGHFNFSQDAFESGRKAVTFNFSSTTPGAVISASTVVVTPLALADLKAYLDEATCTTPVAAGMRGHTASAASTCHDCITSKWVISYNYILEVTAVVDGYASQTLLPVAC